VKILWVKSDFPLPSDTGGKIRTWNLLTKLAERNEVTFLSYVPPNLSASWTSAMASRKICVESVPLPEEKKEGLAFQMRVLSRLPSSRPYIVNKYISREMGERIRHFARNAVFDVLLCDFLEMAWCARHAPNLPTVLFEHNIETLIWRRYHQTEQHPLKRLYFGYEKRRMARFESEACRAVDLVLTVSDNDGQILQREFGVRKYVTIPTAVDTDFFRPGGAEVANRLVFSGSMDWMPNIDAFWWFYRSIYPIVKRSVPAVSFTVIGRRPPKEVLDVAHTDKSVTVTGTVEDVRPFIAEGQLYIVPLRIGGGTRIKIYEAMAMKKCVISTAIGAEGLPLTDGHHIILADDPGDFAEQITSLLLHHDRRNRIAEAAYRHILEDCSWRKSADLLESALNQAVDIKKSRQFQTTRWS
jgi:sugar transferase (PEP-CTERM/EpsH1 system associated)